MTRRLLALAVALLLCLAPLGVQGAGVSYFAVVAATAVSSTVTFTNNHSGGAGVAFNARFVTIINDGGNTIYVDAKDGTATTSDIAVAAGETLRLGPPDPNSEPDGWPTIGIICAAGLTSSVRVVATR